MAKTPAEEYSKKLSNGLIIPTKYGLIDIHNRLIDQSLKTKNIGHYGLRDDSILDYLCDKLENHRYKENQEDNAYYVGTEIFFNIACRHPFTDGNKRTAYIAALAYIAHNFSEICGKNKAFRFFLKKNPKLGQTIETIAKWGEGSNYKSLEDLISKAGLMGKKSRKLNEEDVKRFINFILRNNIQLEKVDKNGKGKEN